MALALAIRLTGWIKGGDGESPGRRLGDILVEKIEFESFRELNGLESRCKMGCKRVVERYHLGRKPPASGDNDVAAVRGVLIRTALAVLVATWQLIILLIAW